MGGSRVLSSMAAAVQAMSIFAGKKVLITGANRGLGLGFAEALTRAGADIIACCRRSSEGLDALSPKPTIITLDVSSQQSVQALPSSLHSVGITSLDYLINNAGISSSNHPIDPILAVKADEIRAVMEVNVVGTIGVTQACLPLLAAASTKCVVNLSSMLASMDQCWGVQGKYGGVSSYRMSKAANNMATRCFSGELRDEGYVFVALSPGHVDTDMGSKGGRTPPLSVQQSIEKMVEVIANLSPADNGKFLNFDGAELPW